jgi:predicted nucleic acid-binding protein
VALTSYGPLVLHNLAPVEAARMVVLVEQYRDTPMGLADASIVAVAESPALCHMFTTDSDLHLYCLVD